MIHRGAQGFDAIHEESSIGHAAETWDNRDVAQMYFEAVKWALGITDRDVTPRKIADSRWGPLRRINWVVYATTHKFRRQIEKSDQSASLRQQPSSSVKYFLAFLSGIERMVMTNPDASSVPHAGS